MKLTGLGIRSIFAYVSTIDRTWESTNSGVPAAKPKLLDLVRHAIRVRHYSLRTQRGDRVGMAMDLSRFEDIA